MIVKNIIVDLGGVILNIDYKRTIEAFRNLSVENADELYSKSSQVKLFDELEKGNISEEDFYSSIQKVSKFQISDVQIRDAWNSLLIDLPEKNVNILHDLKKNYRLFLLSNTNSIHEKAYKKLITEKFGNFIFDDIFEKMYLSNHIHLRKPDRAIFEFVLSDSKLNAVETIFIDDSPQHVEAGTKAGIKSFLLKDEPLEELLDSALNFKHEPVNRSN